MNDLDQKLGDAPAIHVARQVCGNVSVTREGTLVVLKIGNSFLRFRHADAMRIGQWLMARSCEAKLLAGDKSRVETN
jgi:hypothetical protein